jgi:hypothetical protein
MRLGLAIGRFFGGRRRFFGLRSRSTTRWGRGIEQMFWVHVSSGFRGRNEVGIIKDVPIVKFIVRFIDFHPARRHRRSRQDSYVGVVLAECKLRVVLSRVKFMSVLARLFITALLSSLLLCLQEFFQIL